MITRPDPPEPFALLPAEPAVEAQEIADGIMLPSIVLAGLLVLPWLNPFAPGPSPAILPLLICFFCVALAVAMRVFWPVIFTVKRLAWTTASVWLCAGLVSSILGLIQYFGGAEVFVPWVNQSRYGEAFANLRQRNQFASLTNMSLVALVWLGSIFSQAKHRLNARELRNYPVLMLMAAALLACGNATSVSRTGMMQLFLMCGLAIVWGQWRQSTTRRILLVAVIVYVLAVVAFPRLAGFDLSSYSMSGRLQAGDPVCASRLTLWSNVLHLVSIKPWLGWGLGELDYAHYTELYAGPRFCDILDNAHNFALHLAVELGVPFALLVCAGFIFWLWRNRPWSETDPARQMAWGVLGMIFLHSMLEYPLWYGPFQMAVVLCLLLLRRPLTGWFPSPGHPQPDSLRVRVVCALASVLILTGTAYVAWDYKRISQIYLAPEARDAAYRKDTLEKISDSWLFANQVMFARLLTTPLAPANAEWSLQTAQQLLHYSPEPKIAERLIESAVMLGKDEEAQIQIARYRVAFPKEYALWKPVKSN